MVVGNTNQASESVRGRASPSPPRPADLSVVTRPSTPHAQVGIIADHTEQQSRQTGSASPSPARGLFGTQAGANSGEKYTSPPTDRPRPPTTAEHGLHDPRLSLYHRSMTDPRLHSPNTPTRFEGMYDLSDQPYPAVIQAEDEGTNPATYQEHQPAPMPLFPAQSSITDNHSHQDFPNISIHDGIRSNTSSLAADASLAKRDPRLSNDFQVSALSSAARHDTAEISLVAKDNAVPNSSSTSPTTSPVVGDKHEEFITSNILPTSQRSQHSNTSNNHPSSPAANTSVYNPSSPAFSSVPPTVHDPYDKSATSNSRSNQDNILSPFNLAAHSTRAMGPHALNPPPETPAMNMAGQSPTQSPASSTFDESQPKSPGSGISNDDRSESLELESRPASYSQSSAHHVELDRSTAITGSIQTASTFMGSTTQMSRHTQGQVTVSLSGQGIAVGAPSERNEDTSSRSHSPTPSFRQSQQVGLAQSSTLAAISTTNTRIDDHQENSVLTLSREPPEDDQKALDPGEQLKSTPLTPTHFPDSPQASRQDLQIQSSISTRSQITTTQITTTRVDIVVGSSYEQAEIQAKPMPILHSPEQSEDGRSEPGQTMLPVSSSSAHSRSSDLAQTTQASTLTGNEAANTDWNPFDSAPLDKQQIQSKTDVGHDSHSDDNNPASSPSFSEGSQSDIAKSDLKPPSSAQSGSLAQAVQTTHTSTLSDNQTTSSRWDLFTSATLVKEQNISTTAVVRDNRSDTDKPASSPGSPEDRLPDLKGSDVDPPSARSETSVHQAQKTEAPIMSRLRSASGRWNPFASATLAKEHIKSATDVVRDEGSGDDTPLSRGSSVDGQSDNEKSASKPPSVQSQMSRQSSEEPEETIAARIRTTSARWNPFASATLIKEQLKSAPDTAPGGRPDCHEPDSSRGFTEEGQSGSDQPDSRPPSAHSRASGQGVSKPDSATSTATRTPTARWNLFASASVKQEQTKSRTDVSRADHSESGQLDSSRSTPPQSRASAHEAQQAQSSTLISSENSSTNEALGSKQSSSRSPSPTPSEAIVHTIPQSQTILANIQAAQIQSDASSISAPDQGESVLMSAPKGDLSDDACSDSVGLISKPSFLSLLQPSEKKTETQSQPPSPTRSDSSSSRSATPSKLDEMSKPESLLRSPIGLLFTRNQATEDLGHNDDKPVHRADSPPCAAEEASTPSASNVSTPSATQLLTPSHVDSSQTPPAHVDQTPQQIPDTSPSSDGSILESPDANHDDIVPPMPSLPAFEIGSPSIENADAGLRLTDTLVSENIASRQTSAESLRPGSRSTAQAARSRKVSGDSLVGQTFNRRPSADCLSVLSHKVSQEAIPESRLVDGIDSDQLVISASGTDLSVVQEVEKNSKEVIVPESTFEDQGWISRLAYSHLPGFPSSKTSQLSSSNADKEPFAEVSNEITLASATQEIEVQDSAAVAVSSKLRSSDIPPSIATGKPEGYVLEVDEKAIASSVSSESLLEAGRPDEAHGDASKNVQVPAITSPAAESITAPPMEVEAASKVATHDTESASTSIISTEVGSYSESQTITHGATSSHAINTDFSEVDEISHQLDMDSTHEEACQVTEDSPLAEVEPAAEATKLTDPMTSATRSLESRPMEETSTGQTVPPPVIIDEALAVEANISTSVTEDISVEEIAETSSGLSQKEADVHQQSTVQKDAKDVPQPPEEDPSDQGPPHADDEGVVFADQGPQPAQAHVSLESSHADDSVEMASAATERASNMSQESLSVISETAGAVDTDPEHKPVLADEESHEHIATSQSETNTSIPETSLTGEETGMAGKITTVEQLTTEEHATTEEQTITEEHITTLEQTSIEHHAMTEEQAADAVVSAPEACLADVETSCAEQTATEENVVTTEAEHSTLTEQVTVAAQQPAAEELAVISQLLVPAEQTATEGQAVDAHAGEAHMDTSQPSAESVPDLAKDNEDAEFTLPQTERPVEHPEDTTEQFLRETNNLHESATNAEHVSRSQEVASSTEESHPPEPVVETAPVEIEAPPAAGSDANEGADNHQQSVVTEEQANNAVISAPEATLSERDALYANETAIEEQAVALVAEQPTSTEELTVTELQTVTAELALTSEQTLAEEQTTTGEQAMNALEGEIQIDSSQPSVDSVPDLKPHENTDSTQPRIEHPTEDPEVTTEWSSQQTTNAQEAVITYKDSSLVQEVVSSTQGNHPTEPAVDPTLPDIQEVSAAGSETSEAAFNQSQHVSSADQPIQEVETPAEPAASQSDEVVTSASAPIPTDEASPSTDEVSSQLSLPQPAVPAQSIEVDSDDSIAANHEKLHVTSLEESVVATETSAEHDTAQLETTHFDTLISDAGQRQVPLKSPELVATALPDVTVETSPPNHEDSKIAEAQLQPASTGDAMVMTTEESGEPTASQDEATVPAEGSAPSDDSAIDTNAHQVEPDTQLQDDFPPLNTEQAPSIAEEDNQAINVEPQHVLPVKGSAPIASEPASPETSEARLEAANPQHSIQVPLKSPELVATALPDATVEASPPNHEDSKIAEAQLQPASTGDAMVMTTEESGEPTASQDEAIVPAEGSAPSDDSAIDTNAHLVEPDTQLQDDFRPLSTEQAPSIAEEDNQAINVEPQHVLPVKGSAPIASEPASPETSEGRLEAEVSSQLDLPQPAITEHCTEADSDDPMTINHEKLDGASLESAMTTETPFEHVTAQLETTEVVQTPELAATALPDATVETSAPSHADSEVPETQLQPASTGEETVMTTEECVEHTASQNKATAPVEGSAPSEYSAIGTNVHQVELDTQLQDDIPSLNTEQAPSLIQEDSQATIVEPQHVLPTKGSAPITSELAAPEASEGQLEAANPQHSIQSLPAVAAVVEEPSEDHNEEPLATDVQPTTNSPHVEAVVMVQNNSEQKTDLLEAVAPAPMLSVTEGLVREADEGGAKVALPDPSQPPVHSAPVAVDETPAAMTEEQRAAELQLTHRFSAQAVAAEIMARTAKSKSNASASRALIKPKVNSPAILKTDPPKGAKPSFANLLRSWGKRVETKPQTSTATVAETSTAANSEPGEAVVNRLQPVASAGQPSQEQELPSDPTASDSDEAVKLAQVPVSSKDASPDTDGDPIQLDIAHLSAESQLVVTDHIIEANSTDHVAADRENSQVGTLEESVVDTETAEPATTLLENSEFTQRSVFTSTTASGTDEKQVPKDGEVLEAQLRPVSSVNEVVMMTEERGLDHTAGQVGTTAPVEKSISTENTTRETDARLVQPDTQPLADSPPAIDELATSITQENIKIAVEPQPEPSVKTPVPETATPLTLVPSQPEAAAIASEPIPSETTLEDLREDAADTAESSTLSPPAVAQEAPGASGNDSQATDLEPEVEASPAETVVMIENNGPLEAAAPAPGLVVEETVEEADTSQVQPQPSVASADVTVDEAPSAMSEEQRATELQLAMQASRRAVMSEILARAAKSKSDAVTSSVRLPQPPAESVIVTANEAPTAVSEEQRLAELQLAMQTSRRAVMSEILARAAKSKSDTVASSVPLPQPPAQSAVVAVDEAPAALSEEQRLAEVQLAMQTSRQAVAAEILARAAKTRSNTVASSAPLPQPAVESAVVIVDEAPTAVSEEQRLAELQLAMQNSRQAVAAEILARAAKSKSDAVALSIPVQNKAIQMTTPKQILSAGVSSNSVSKPSSTNSVRPRGRRDQNKTRQSTATATESTTTVTESTTTVTKTTTTITGKSSSGIGLATTSSRKMGSVVRSNHDGEKHVLESDSPSPLSAEAAMTVISSWEQSDGEPATTTYQETIFTGGPAYQVIQDPARCKPGHTAESPPAVSEIPSTTLEDKQSAITQSKSEPLPVEPVQEATPKAASRASEPPGTADKAAESDQGHVEPNNPQPPVELAPPAVEEPSASSGQHNDGTNNLTYSETSSRDLCAATLQPADQTDSQAGVVALDPDPQSIAEKVAKNTEDASMEAAQPPVESALGVSEEAPGAGVEEPAAALIQPQAELSTQEIIAKEQGKQAMLTQSQRDSLKRTPTKPTYYSSLSAFLSTPSPSTISIPKPPIDPATIAKKCPTSPVVTNVMREVILPPRMKKLSLVSVVSMKNYSPPECVCGHTSPTPLKVLQDPSKQDGDSQPESPAIPEGKSEASHRQESKILATTPPPTLACVSPVLEPTAVPSVVSRPHSLVSRPHSLVSRPHSLGSRPTPSRGSSIRYVSPSSPGRTPRAVEVVERNASIKIPVSRLRKRPVLKRVTLVDHGPQPTPSNSQSKGQHLKSPHSAPSVNCSVSRPASPGNCELPEVDSFAMIERTDSMSRAPTTDRYVNPTLGLRITTSVKDILHKRQNRGTMAGQSSSPVTRTLAEEVEKKLASMSEEPRISGTDAVSPSLPIVGGSGISGSGNNHTTRTSPMSSESKHSTLSSPVSDNETGRRVRIRRKIAGAAASLAVKISKYADPSS